MSNIEKSIDMKNNISSRRYPFTIYFDMNKAFNTELKDINLDTEIPIAFKDMKLEPGVYSYGTASADSIDADGEKVIIDEPILKKLTDAPYNKIFISHDRMDIASGIIKYAGRHPSFNNEAIILERINEHHPLFHNIVGSIQNHNLDSYSVAGEATKEYGFDSNSGKMTSIRKVKELREVSRTSCPSNPEAAIKGLFFVKTQKGGYTYTQEEIDMEKELQEKFDSIEKSLNDYKLSHDKALEELGKRCSDVETFKKSIEEERLNLEKKKKEDADAIEKAKADKTKADVNTTTEPMQKTLADSKAIIKDNLTGNATAPLIPSDVSKTPLMNFLKGR